MFWSPILGCPFPSVTFLFYAFIIFSFSLRHRLPDKLFLLFPGGYGGNSTKEDFSSVGFIFCFLLGGDKRGSFFSPLIVCCVIPEIFYRESRLFLNNMDLLIVHPRFSPLPARVREKETITMYEVLIF